MRAASMRKLKMNSDSLGRTVRRCASSIVVLSPAAKYPRCSKTRLRVRRVTTSSLSCLAGQPDLDWSPILSTCSTLLNGAIPQLDDDGDKSEDMFGKCYIASNRYLGPSRLLIDAFGKKR